MPTAGQGRISGAEHHAIEINAVEIAALHRFVNAHVKCHQGGYPARVEVSTTSNGIGSTVVVKCLACAVSATISDLDSW